MTLDEYLKTRPHGDLEATRLTEIIRAMEQEQVRLQTRAQILDGAYSTADLHRTEAVKWLNESKEIIKLLQSVITSGVLELGEFRDKVLLARIDDDEIVATLNRMITGLSEVCDV